MDKAMTALYARMERAIWPTLEMEPKPRFVPGEGPEHPTLVLIGEAPGKLEAQQGRPFVGPAGKQLDAFLAEVSLPREALYVTNAVKYRPTRISPSGGIVNRTPTRAEVAAFAPWLAQELALLRPGMIATLGGVPLAALLGWGARIGDMHGKLLVDAGLPAPLFALYHPASVIYNPALRPVYQADLQALAALLGGQSDN